MKAPSSSHRKKTTSHKCSCTLQIRGSIVVSISACHADDPGSIPGRGVPFTFCAWDMCEFRSHGICADGPPWHIVRVSVGGGWSPVAQGHTRGYAMAARGIVLGVECRWAGWAGAEFALPTPMPSFSVDTKDRIV